MSCRSKARVSESETVAPQPPVGMVPQAQAQAQTPLTPRETCHYQRRQGKDYEVRLEY
ncbi:hypothetical protein SAMN05216188_13911 [Lentzea xinjiangensis]|uniref:Uncharacterized protein n=1 Tax=Lentzea xinjiangensis TaxID=402600 RepID=A0A1H9WQT6_9PSEU|nr:hypothetical protein SAMN05216188_13911 [Lentzea xinjiangensis]